MYLNTIHQTESLKAIECDYQGRTGHKKFGRTLGGLVSHLDRCLGWAGAPFLT